MKTKHPLKSFVVTVLVVGGLIGLWYFLSKIERSQPKGYYTAQDTLKSYNLGYQKGSENTRQAIKCERTDTTIKSCQDK